MAQAVGARVRVPQLRLIVPMPRGLAADAWSVALGKRRRVLRGGTVRMGRMVSLGVLAWRHPWTVLSRVRGGLARQFSGLMAQAVVARICVPQLRLIVPMPRVLAADAWRVALRKRRRVLRGGGTVRIGRMVSRSVLPSRD